MRTPFALRAWQATLGRSRGATVLAMSAVALNLTGCAAVKGIFKAGIWVGVVLAIFAMVGVLALMRTFSRH